MQENTQTVGIVGEMNVKGVIIMEEQKFTTLQELTEQTNDLPFEEYLKAVAEYFRAKYKKD